MEAGHSSAMQPEKGDEKKQVLLRLSPSLWKELAQWAADDFRSINGQIEFLLSECVRGKKRRRRAESEANDRYSV